MAMDRRGLVLQESLLKSGYKIQAKIYPKRTGLVTSKMTQQMSYNLTSLMSKIEKMNMKIHER